LALDGIADVTPGSEFYGTMSLEQQMLMTAVSISSKDIEENWPCLPSILSQVCAHIHSYDNVVKALKKEDVNKPIVEYLQDITYN